MSVVSVVSSNAVLRTVAILKAGGPGWEERLSRMTYLRAEAREEVGLAMMEWSFGPTATLETSKPSDLVDTEVSKDSPAEINPPLASLPSTLGPEAAGPSNIPEVDMALDDDSLASSDHEEWAETLEKSLQESDEVEVVTPRSAPTDISGKGKGKEKQSQEDVVTSPRTPVRPKPRPISTKTTPKSAEFVVDSDAELPTAAEASSRVRVTQPQSPNKTPSVVLRPGQRMLHDKELISGTGLYSEKLYEGCESPSFGCSWGPRY